jgi:hypothetical protein
MFSVDGEFSSSDEESSSSSEHIAKASASASSTGHIAKASASASSSGHIAKASGSVDIDALCSDDDDCADIDALCSDEDELLTAGRTAAVPVDAPAPQRALSCSAFVEQRSVQSWFRDLELTFDDQQACQSFQNLKRKIGVLEHSLSERATVAEDKLSATGEAFNKGRLRREDRIDESGSIKRRWTGRWVHAKAWNIDSTIELAFSGIGSLCPNAPALRTTRRNLDAIAATSLAASHHIADSCKSLIDSYTCGARSSYFFLAERCHDCTPVRVQFGSLRELADVARFWHFDREQASWKLLTSTEFGRAAGPLPKFGTVELMAQSFRIHWSVKLEDFMSVESRQLRMPVCYLARSTGSNMLAALHAACPSIDFAHLRLIAQLGVNFVFLYVGSDLASSGGRLKFELARRATEYNQARSAHEGCIILVDGQCAAHVLHREIESAFSTVQLIPKLYATAFSISMAGTFARVVQHLEAIVRRDLVTGFHPHMRPPSDDALSHTKALAEVCILRVRYVRARTEDGSVVPDDLQQLFDEYLNIFNGDLRRPRIEHFCHDVHCCQDASGQPHDRDVAVKRIVNVLMGVCFDSAGHDLPSATRWSTFSPHLARQAIGLFTHDVLARVAGSAFEIAQGLGGFQRTQ